MNMSITIGIGFWLGYLLVGLTVLAGCAMVGMLDDIAKRRRSTVAKSRTPTLRELKSMASGAILIITGWPVVVVSASSLAVRKVFAENGWTPGTHRTAATDTAGQRTGREAAGGSEPPQAGG